MKIKICKYKRVKFEGKMFVEVKMTFLGFILRNNWTITEDDFESDYIDRWVPCYINLGYLLKTRFGVL